MENNDIDKIFTSKFRKLPGDAYSEDRWSSLSSRLDTHENRRNRWLLPVLLPLFALLAAGNVFWWYQWREVVQNHQNTGNTTTLFQTDTIVKTTVLHRFDTIYQNLTVVKKRILEVPGPAVPLIPDQNTSFGSVVGQNLSPAATSKNGDQATLTNTAITDSEKPKETINDTQKNIPEPSGNSFKYNNNTDTLKQDVGVSATQSEKDQQTVDSTFEQVQATLPVTRKSQSPKMYLARPRLSLSGAWSHLTTEHFTNGYLLGFGLGTDVEIARNIRLGASLDYWSGKLKIEETEELTGFDVPNPGNNYDLKHVESDQLAAMTYALHLRYQFPLKGNWSPWVGMGAQATTQLPFDITFEYENEIDDDELKLTEQTETKTYFQGMLLLLGVEGKISRQFSWGAEGFWLLPLVEESGYLNNQLGLKTRLYYHF
jgi:hypothetical protein